MGYSFQANDAIQFAIQIEKNGEKFYREAAKNVEDEEVKKILTYLADEEVGHRKVFERMLSKIETVTTDEFSREYFDYLFSYSSNYIFTKDIDISSMKNVLEIIEFAINRETSSISYYSEIRNIIVADKQYVIDEVIDEERKHFVKLMKLSDSIKERRQ